MPDLGSLVFLLQSPISPEYLLFINFVSDFIFKIIAKLQDFSIMTLEAKPFPTAKEGRQRGSGGKNLCDHCQRRRSISLGEFKGGDGNAKKNSADE